MNAVATRHQIAAIVITATLLGACGSRPTASAEPEPPEVPANASNTVIVPAVGYGKTAEGLQLTAADDQCNASASLVEAIQEQLTAPYVFAMPQPTPAVDGAPTLRIEITDILANAGGLYGGPKIVQLHGTLQSPGGAAVQFTARREMFIYFGLPRSTCSKVGKVTYALGADIAAWLVKPVDGAKLGAW